MLGRRWNCQQEEAVFEGELKCNLPGLINKKGNKDKGEFAKLKQDYKNFTLEDDLS